MKHLTYLLLLLSTNQYLSQTIFDKFQFDYQAMSDLTIGMENIYALEKKLETYVEEIALRFPDSLFKYKAKLYRKKCELTGRPYTEPRDFVLFEQYSDQLLYWAHKTNDPSVWADALYTRSIFYLKNRNYPKMIRSLLRSLLLALEIKDSELVIRFGSHNLRAMLSIGDLNQGKRIVEACIPHTNIESDTKIEFFDAVAEVYEQSHEYTQAFSYYSKALDIAINNQDSSYLPWLHVSLARIHVSMQEYDKALDYATKAKSLYEQSATNGVGYRTFFLYASLAEAYNAMDILDSALNYANLAYDICVQRGDRENQIIINFRKSQILLKQGEYYASKKAVLPVIDFYTQNNSPSQVVKCYNSLIPAYQHLKMYDSAIYYARLGIQHYEEVSNLEDMVTFNGLLGESYQMNGDWKGAAITRTHQIELQDSLFQKNKANDIAQAETKMKTQLIAYEKDYFKLESEKKEAINQKNKVIQRKDASIKLYLGAAIVGSVFILSMVIFSLVVRNQSKKRQIALNLITIDNHRLNEKSLKDKLIILREQLNAESNEDREERSTQNQSLLAEKLKPNNWMDFLTAFNSIYGKVIDRLRERYPDLSRQDIKIIALTKMNLTIKETSHLLAVSDAAVSKAKLRLRNKLGLNKSSEIGPFIDDFLRAHCQI